jgi:hypothetical protein
MNDNDIELLLYRILTGRNDFIFNNEKYTLYCPSVDIKYEACIVYDNIINDEKYHDWIREENITPVMISLGIWNSQTDKNLKVLEQKLDNLKVDLFNNFILPSKTKTIRANIKNTKQQINKITYMKQNFLSNTLEGYASSIKNEFIICKTLYRNNKLLFNDDSPSSKSYMLFNALIQEIDKSIISMENYKILARHQIWRSYWNSAKKNSLFSKSIVELTDEQRAMINISSMYDNIYEHPDCPNDAILSDDDALDGWMIVQKRKNEQAKKKADFQNKNENIKNAGEVFVMTETSEDAESVMNLNTIESKMIFREKMNHINNKGTVNDGDLPDVQRDLRTAISQLRAKDKRN